jgi:hypothetical protein
VGSPSSVFATGYVMSHLWGSGLGIGETINMAGALQEVLRVIAKRVFAHGQYGKKPHPCK